MDSQLIIDKIIQLAFLAVTSPLWVPVVKLMYREVQSSLREEGGLFGRKPTPRERERIEHELGAYEHPMVVETWDEKRAKRAGRAPSRAAPRTTAPGSAAPGSAGARRPSGGGSALRNAPLGGGSSPMGRVGRPQRRGF